MVAAADRNNRVDLMLKMEKPGIVLAPYGSLYPRGLSHLRADPSSL